MNRIEAWFNSSNKLACLICIAFFAMGVGWMVALSATIDCIKSGYIVLVIFSAITCLAGLIAFLFGLSVVNNTLIFTHFAKSTYPKADINKENKDSNTPPNPRGTHFPDDCTNNQEDYPQTKKHKYLSHFTGVYRLYRRLSTRNEENHRFGRI